MDCQGSSVSSREESYERDELPISDVDDYESKNEIDEKMRRQGRSKSYLQNKNRFYEEECEEHEFDDVIFKFNIFITMILLLFFFYYCFY